VYFSFLVLGDFDPLRVPQNALRAFHLFQNAYQMGISEKAVTNITDIKRRLQPRSE